jgi:hypothetical protein
MREVGGGARTAAATGRALRCGPLPPGVGACGACLADAPVPHAPHGLGLGSEYARQRKPAGELEYAPGTAGRPVHTARDTFYVPSRDEYIKFN